MPDLSYIKKYVQATMMPKAGLKRAIKRASPQTKDLLIDIHAREEAFLKKATRRKVIRESTEFMENMTME